MTGSPITTLPAPVTIGRATLYCGDAAAILPTLGSIDACVTDPPYEFETSGAGIFRTNRKNMDQITAAGLDKGFDHTSLTADQFGSMILFAHNDQWADLLPYLRDQYGRFVICQWHKLNPMPVANKHYQPDTEIYVHAWRSGFHPAGELRQKQRFIIAPNGQDLDVPHPTVKPIQVMRKIIANVTGEVVCDPYCGSGTTGIAAVQAGKQFIGIERDPAFFALACDRIDKAQRQGNLFEVAA